jgi:hypothetical protein
MSFYFLLDNLDSIATSPILLREDGNGRNRVTQAEYFRYHLFPRANEFNHIFMAGKLFQEYVVDSWATTEQSRLNWIRYNQNKIRAETYQGLTDAVAANNNRWT